MLADKPLRSAVLAILPDTINVPVLIIPVPGIVNSALGRIKN